MPFREPVRGYTAPKHCWVCVTGRWNERRPGLLVQWARGERGWQALVLEASGGGTTAPFALLHWVDASHVQPTDPAPSGS